VNAYQAERREILEKFGLDLARRRDPRTTSQEAFSKKVGLHRNQIGFMERGKREPGLLTLLILADTLGIKPGELLEDLPAPKERRPPAPSKGTTRKAPSQRKSRTATSR
jgi:transcriptional regulator with XRE-family HTH domain